MIDNKIKLNEYANKYPGLRKLGDHSYNHCEQVSFKRVDENVLESIPVVTKITGPLANIAHGDVVYLLDARNRVIGTVEPAVACHSADPRKAEWESYGESVLEAIYRLGLEETTEFVAWVRFGYNIQGGASQPTWRVTWYNPADNIVSGLVTKHIAEATLVMAVA